MKILTLAWVVIFQVAFLTNADARGGGAAVVENPIVL